MFGLLGLLIAFTFSGAAGRFEDRRHLIVEEANDIGTAYLRLDLLSEKMRGTLRGDFRDYLDSRTAFYQHVGSQTDAAAEDTRRATSLQAKIWAETVAGCQEINSNATTSLALASLNDMFDITTTRSFALEDHPPAVVFWSLGVLALAGSLVAGFGMATAERPSRLHMALYSLIMALSFYVILDLEYPRAGLIRVDAADHVLTDLRNSMR